MKRCWLKATEVRLLDGELYTFRRLSFASEVTMELMDAIEGDGSAGEMLRTMGRAVRESLSWDQERDVVEGVINSGALPFALTEGTEEEVAITAEVFEAMTGVAIGGGGKRGKKGRPGGNG